ncbi:hypothetical protein ACIOD0_22830 [Kitasatospora albolonga]
MRELGQGASVSAYERRLVEHLLPAVWNPGAAHGIRHPQVPDADMPKGTVDPRTTDVICSHLADIQQAWGLRPLPGERRTLFLRYALDWSNELIAAHDSLTARAVRYRLERGVGMLAAHLNSPSYVDR